MTNEKLYKSGDKAPVSGQYKVVGPRGGSKEREITMIEGKKNFLQHNPIMAKNIIN